MRLLELRNINKSYKINDSQSFQVLKNINVSFDKGELVSIIGESGSGKSTIMNLIGGLDSQFDGELLVDGQNIGTFSEKELDCYRKDQIGFVFQNCNLIPHLSILDNVTIALTLSNVDKNERIEKATKALEQVGLAKHIHKKPNQLSGGQRQRVAIARALINDPEIILADEPTGALDSETTKQVLDIIQSIAQKGKLVIMVTHSEKVAAHSSRVIQILDGEIIKDTTQSVSDCSSTLENNIKQSTPKVSENLSFLSATKLAAHNMKQKLKRNILVALGVSIGIMSVVTMLALGNGIKSYFSNMIDSFMNPLVVEVSMEQATIDPNDPMSAMTAIGMKEPFKEENLKELSEIKGVKEVEKGFQYITMTPSNSISYGDTSCYLMGLTSMSSVLTEANLAEGKLPSAENEILINQSVYDELGHDVLGQVVEVDALIDNQPIKGEFVVSGVYTAGDHNALADTNHSIYVNYSAIESLLAEQGHTLEPTMVYLVADDENTASQIKTTITDLGYGGSTQEMMGDQMLTMLNILTIVLAGIAGISLLVSSIMILVVLYISVVERTKEIGLLRAIGARSKDIKRIFVSEAFLIGITSGTIGLVTAYVVSIVVNYFSMQIFEMNVMNLTIPYCVVGVLLSTIVSMIAGLFPAQKAAKLDPVDSLRTE
ncbi:MAG: ATP-binding cassette domain-containing protein [Cellulosilyticum sp.]|nr:ATP-binding cassette domain-containing protein [Cellulosilyticum sp.]